MPGTTRVLRRLRTWKGRVFDVERERIRVPNGRTVVVDIVRHRGSVVLIPRVDRTHLVLIRQYRHPIRRWIWELPAGSIEARENPRVAARRECEEEIGLTPRRVQRLASFYPTPGFCDENMTFYLCEDLQAPKGPVARDVDEQIEPRTFSLREIDALIARGQIIDMKTVVGVGLVRAFKT